MYCCSVAFFCWIPLAFHCHTVRCRSGLRAFDALMAVCWEPGLLSMIGLLRGYMAVVALVAAVVVVAVVGRTLVEVVPGFVASSPGYSAWCASFVGTCFPGL